MSKWLWRALLVFLLLSFIYVALPWYTAKQIVQAARADDTAQLQRYIDFPTLRDNLKVSLRSELRESMGDSMPAELDGLFAAGSDLIIGPLVERLVTPDAIGDIIKGRKDLRELQKQWRSAAHERRAGNEPAVSSKSSDQADKAEVGGAEVTGSADRRWHLHRWGFSGPNLFTADCGNEKREVRLVMQRQGVVWRLVDIELL